MVNALKGKTLTTMTIILPNKEIAAELMDVANDHFEFTQEKSYPVGPLKLIQYYISLAHSGKKVPHFLMERHLRKLGE